jgi:flagellar motility protein MotE (MotC chaperone)
VKAWLLVGLAAPALVVAPFALPILAQDKAATGAPTEAAAKAEGATEKKAPGDLKRESIGGATAKEEAELSVARRKRTTINDVKRCPKRPTETQFRTYNLLNDQMLKLKQRRSRQDAAERRLADLQRQIMAQRDELLKLQRLLDEKLTQKEIKEAEARAQRIRKLVKILEVMQPGAGAQTATGITMDLLVELLLRMKPKKAAGILNLVPSPLAARTFEEVSSRKKGLIEALLERVEGQ